MKSSKPSMLKQSKLLSGREMMNRGRWSGTGGWTGEVESGIREHTVHVTQSNTTCHAMAATVKVSLSNIDGKNLPW